jgi:hypothetical protein
MPPENLPIKTFFFFILAFLGMFATISIYCLWTFAALGAGYLYSETPKEVLETPMGTLGNAFLAIVVNCSGFYLLIAVWTFVVFTTIWLFSDEINNSLKWISARRISIGVRIKRKRGRDTEL